MKKISIAAFSLLVASASLAQQKVVADKIVGIVGDKIVLKSEIFVANEDIKRQGGQEQHQRQPRAEPHQQGRK